MQARLDIDYTLHFAGGQTCKVESIIVWGEEERVGPALAWNAKDGDMELATLFAEG